MVGKTTVIQLLTGFITPDRDSISINGINIQSLNLTELRSNIAIVSQQVHLLNASIQENLLIGKLGATKSEINNAIATAGSAEFIKLLPDDINTVIGDQGIRLSGGNVRGSHWRGRY